MIRKLDFSTTKTTRIFTHGEFNENTTHLWIVCHGYGQLANYFIRNFQSLPKSHFIIAPEALNHFYTQGFQGRVGASWMTKENRLSDINDYVKYLDEVFIRFYKPNLVINVLGFSQGGATVARWYCQSKSVVDNLILWSAVYPPDLDFQTDADKINNTKFKIVIGDKDEFIDNNTISEQLKILDQNQVNYELITFHGSHKIYPDVLKQLF